MSKSVAIIKRVEEAKEKIRGYYEHQEIQAQILSLNSNLSRYLRELKTYYWRLKILTKIFNKEIPTEKDKETQEIFVTINNLSAELSRQISTSILKAANETITRLNSNLSEINERFSSQIHENRKELERIIYAKASLAKIKDLRGFSLLKTEDERYFKDKIAPRLYSPTSEDTISEFKEFYTIWTNFERQIKKVMSLDLLKDKYGMTQESVDVIQKLVSGEKTNLSTLNSKILGDLQKLPEFCKTVSLKIE